MELTLVSDDDASIAIDERLDEPTVPSEKVRVVKMPTDCGVVLVNLSTKEGRHLHWHVHFGLGKPTSKQAFSCCKAVWQATQPAWLISQSIELELG